MGLGPNSSFLKPANGSSLHLLCQHSLTQLHHLILFHFFIQFDRINPTSQNGAEEGGDVDARRAAGRLRPRESVQGPGGHAGDEGVSSQRKMDRHREGQDLEREGQVVLPR